VSKLAPPTVDTKEVDRKQAAHRKSLHGLLVNQTLTLGKNIKTEKVSVRAWQKIFGKSEESEPRSRSVSKRRVYETYVVSWNPPDLSGG